MTSAADVPADPVHAAGAVLWRPAGDDTPPAARRTTLRADDVEVALVHRPKYDDWSLPKGKLDAGEHALEAAVREVAEETGYTAVLGRPLRGSRYVVDSTSGPRYKIVDYWSAEVVAGAFVPGDEVDELRWLPVPEARAALSRPTDRPVVDDFAAAAPHTVPLIVLRHAHALPRKEWEGDDEARPVSAVGEAQARGLVGMLAAYGVTSVITSPSLRCLQTVAPFAEKHDVPLRRVHGLSEPGFQEDPGVARDVVERALAAKEPTVICSHRPALPALLAAMQELVGAMPPRRPVRKGEFAVAHVAHRDALALERHRPVAG